jgi:hypothetical protein
MFFLIDKERKILFGWSAKFGCSHVKRMFYFLQGQIDHPLHTSPDYGKLFNIQLNEYKIFIFIRNPYERIVSGFLDKYAEPNGAFYHMWNKDIPLTFNNFVNDLTINTYKHIQRHHFTPQLSEAWHNIIKTQSALKVYDIFEIDYEYLGSIYNKIIPSEIINFRGDHANKKEIVDCAKVYNLLQKDYTDKRPVTASFHNTELANKIHTFYKVDFDFFESIGLTYNVSV